MKRQRRCLESKRGDRHISTLSNNHYERTYREQCKQAFVDTPSLFVPDWVYGWKRTQLLVSANEPYQLALLNGGIFVKLDDTAICRGSIWAHQPDSVPHDHIPAPLCFCGFYADSERSHTSSGYGPFEARVALSGTVLECDYGYRAERQVVTDIWCPSTCLSYHPPERSNPAAFLVVDPSDKYEPDGTTYLRLYPECAWHYASLYATKPPTFTPEQLSEIADIRITWEDEMAPIS